MPATELDLGHITAVCTRLADTGIADGLNVTPTNSGYTVTSSAMDSEAQAIVAAALRRVGYLTSSPDLFAIPDVVTITGWNESALNERVTGLRNVINVRGHRAGIAAAAIERAPNRDLANPDGPLRTSIEAKVGVLPDYVPDGPYVPTDQPDQYGARRRADLVEKAHQLEAEALAHIRLHAKTAEIAIDLYEQYRPRMSDMQARASAVADACHLARSQPGATPPNQYGATIPASRTTTMTVIQREDAPDPADTAQPTDEPPSAIAAHDQPNETYAGRTDIQSIPDTQSAPAFPRQQHGPTHGPATR